MTTHRVPCKTGGINRSDIIRIWRENRCIRESSIAIYLQWIHRFEGYCQTRGLEPKTELTAVGVRVFAKAYAQARSIPPKTALCGARSALHAWAQALNTLGDDLPAWDEPSCPKRVLPSLVEAFIEHLRQHRGNAASTLRKKARHVLAFLAFLRRRRQRIANLSLNDIDAYLIAASTRYKRSVVADISGNVRDFLRFLHATGRLSSDIASSVVTPRLRPGERPLRSLPWAEVQRILKAVDCSGAGGQRDYALLLLMSVYGLGAGEVTGLTLDDIDWRAATIHVVRPKTGVEIVLPLLPAVARTLVRYLRHGRPAHTPTRHLFVQMRLPHRRLSGSSAIRHIVVKHARRAGVEASYLGSHVLRHSHARQQTELGVAPQVIGDILGHRRPESTSAYIHIATERLRELALRVPQ